MHGLIVRSFVDFAEERYPGDGPLTATSPPIDVDAAYDDAEFGKLVTLAAERATVSVGDFLREFGMFTAQNTFYSLFPDFYAQCGDTRTFMLSIEKKIHELVRATVRYATPPRLQVRPLGAGGVMITYTSERNLCELLDGLVRGTAAYYGESFEISELECMKRGSALGCVFTVEPA